MLCWVVYPLLVPVLVSGDIGTISIDLAQLSRFYLKTETESSLRNVVIININRTVLECACYGNSKYVWFPLLKAVTE
jgi:hypothetical protein